MKTMSINTKKMVLSSLFLAVGIWYCIQRRKADKMFFDKGAVKGNTIKNKALKK